MKLDFLGVYFLGGSFDSQQVARVCGGRYFRLSLKAVQS